MGRLNWLAALIFLSLAIAYPAIAEQPVPLNPRPASEGLEDQYFNDFYTSFAPEALALEPSELRAAYDVLILAAERIHDGKYKSAADVFAILPKDVEVLLRPVVAMREDIAMADTIRPFAKHEARAELMEYHATVWTSHPDFAEDFSAFSEDFALRASRREKTKGAPYILDKLNIYGFVPKGAGGPQQAYLFLWTKFNEISKFADACIKLGLNYRDVKIEDYDARVAQVLADEIEAAKKGSMSTGGGRQTWSELIEYYKPEEEIITSEPGEGATGESLLEPVITTETVETPSEETTPAEPGELVIEEVEPEAPIAEEPLPLDVLMNPLSLFVPPGETPSTEVIPELPETEVIEETPVAEEPAEPVEEEPAAPVETIVSTEVPPVAEPPASKPPETVSKPPTNPAVLPKSIAAQPVSPDDIEGALVFGTPVGGAPAGSTTTPPKMAMEDVLLNLGRISDAAIDAAGEKGLELGRQAVELAKVLSSDPAQEKQETKDQLTKYRTSRSNFLAAVAIIDRYRLEQYVNVPVEDIEKQVLDEIYRPYDDLKASALWDKYREKEKDFDDAFTLVKTHFLERRKSESIYAGEMAALESHIMDYEKLIIEIEELLAMGSLGKQPPG